ncbi:MAG: hypothetical protein KAG14_00920 [Mycoplasmataceae bacterium]|nr:hypothetical protein [Mycoplasmataceae bacterium]
MSIAFSIFLIVGGFFLIKNKFGNVKIGKRDFIVVRVSGKGYYPFSLTLDKGLTIAQVVEHFMIKDSIVPTIYKTTKGKVLRANEKVFRDTIIKV